jgi:hypothetical protein
VVRGLLSHLTAVQIPVRAVLALAITAMVVGAAIWAGAAVMGASRQAGGGDQSSALGVGKPTFSAGSASGPAARPDPAGPQGWAELLQSLYRRRADAFTRGSAALLEQVYTDSSAQLQSDRAAVGALTSAGHVLRGFGPESVRVTDVVSSGDRIELHVVDSWSAYEVVSRASPGSAVGSGAARGEAPVLVVLRRASDGWRIETVERLTSSEDR